ncbi:MAG: (d)CMP kinase [Gammaproteobacteria bacterium]|nr:(d)CMP kinase [Gammaproteobacteria bacterium]
MSDIPVITIDGPSGSGKGTISRTLAQMLGWHFLDSGALYRLVGLGGARHHIANTDEEKIANYARELAVRFETGDPDAEPRIYLEDHEVSGELRTETCGELASQVAAIPAVREALLARQRDFRQAPGLVADGRDMGTTVFPEANLKIYLTASAEVRAQRRYKQLKDKGISVNLAALVQDINKRDARDSSRSVSPLVPAIDAIVVDTSEMDIPQVMNRVQELVRQALPDVTLGSPSG